MSDSARPRRIRGIRSLARKQAVVAARKSGVIVASMMVVFGTAFGSGAFATGGELSEPTASVSETIVEETVENQPAQEQTQTSQESASQESESAQKSAEKKSNKPAKPAKPAKPEVPEPSSSDIPAGADGIGAGLKNVQLQAVPNPLPVPNPPLPEKCGLDIALVFDLSNSLRASDVTNSKVAGRAFVDILTGTPSSVGVYSFATFAPATGNSNFSALSIGDQNGADTVKARIDGLTQPGGNDGGTNWDRGLAAVGSGYDVVLFMSDGNPTAYGTPGTPGNPDLGFTVDDIDINKGIESANNLKAEPNPAFVMALGVGQNISEQNLKYVSGDREGIDYLKVSDYQALAGVLEGIATKNCAGTVTVNKKVKDLNGNLANAPGWQFSATEASNVTPASGTTDANGLINFQLNKLGWNETRTVEIAETLQPGYELEKQDGKNAVCVDRNNNDAPVAVTDSGDLGFKVDVTGNANQVVICTVINKVKAKPLTVKKTAAASYHTKYEWGIEKDVDETSFTIDEGDANPKANYTVTVTEGDKVDSAHKVAGKITVTNPNPTDVTGVTVTDQLDQDASCTVDGGTNVTVPANGSKVLEYTCSFEAAPGQATGTNTAKATWDGGEATGTADYDFTRAEVTEENKTVTITDSYTGAWEDDPTITWSQSGETHKFTYERELEGTPGKCTTFDNTATIVETEQSDNASTEVCVSKAPESAKDAIGSFTRDFDWKVTKSVVEDSYAVEAGEQVNPDYTVVAEVEKVTDSDIKVVGEIEVTNPNNYGEALTATVTDQLYAGEAALEGAVCKVEGQDSHQVAVAAGETKKVAYECVLDELPEGEITNHATVAWPNEQSSVAKAEVSFEGTYVDTKVVVTDDKTVEGESNELGTVEVNKDTGEIKGENTFTYNDVALTAPAADSCETFVNTAVVDETTNKDENNTDTAKVEVCANPEEVVPTPTPEETPEPTKEPKEPLADTGAQVAGIAIGGALLIGAGLTALIYSRRRAMEG